MAETRRPCWVIARGQRTVGAFVVALVLAMLPAQTVRAVPPDLTVASFNIRYGTAKDGDDAWPKRREIVLETMRVMDADVFGLQEVLDFQRQTIEEAFAGYEAIGRGRNADGGGEHCTILVRRDRLEVLASGTFWLSDTPDVPASRGWGNRITRICTWARLRDKSTKREFVLLNTHFDHESQPSRERSAQLLVERLPALAKTGPLLLTGDLNAGEDNAALETLRTAKLRDTFRVKHPEVEHVGTFNGFEGRNEGAKIDYVLVSKEWDVKSAAIVRRNEDGRYPSDHYPVVASVGLKPDR